MAAITKEEMAERLSLKTHRDKFFVVRWIEESIRSGKANTDFGTSCKEVIEEVSVKYADGDNLAYEVEDGVVKNVLTGYKSQPYFLDPAAPTAEELSLVEVVYPEHFQWLTLLCMNMGDYFDHPHSCSIDYHIVEKDCRCGNKRGAVNYDGFGEWQFYCGGSDRCCP